MGRKESIRIYIILIVVILGSLTAVFFLNRVIAEREEEKRALRLSSIHNSAVSQLQSSIDQFAAVATSMRTYFESKSEIPSAEAFQKFTNDLLHELQFKGQYVVSAIDADHHFIYVFDQHQIDTEQLSGKPIPQSNNPEIIARMDSIMLDREIHMSRPINLYEGWLGISFSFSFYNNEKALGYVTPILSLQEILETIYTPEISEDFVFKFQTANGEYFDRKKIYNSSAKDMDPEDPEFFKNFTIDEDDFLETSIEMYNQRFFISTAFKKPLPKISPTSMVILVCAALFMLAFTFITWQTLRLRSLNFALLHSQEVISNQKKALEKQNIELKKLNHTKDMFFSIIGHDLKSPLATIDSLIDLKLKNQSPLKDDKELFIHLKKTTQRTLDLLKNLLQWAMLNSNKLQKKKELIDLKTLAIEVVTNAETQIEQKGLTLHSKFKNDIYISADKNMIQTAIRNLLSNAIKFTEKGGAIVIEGKITGQTAHLSVSDTGIGMSAEQVENLFNMEQREISTDTEGKTGTGLGLVLTRDFIESNKGTITVKSIPGKGTTFDIQFPAKMMDAVS